MKHSPVPKFRCRLGAPAWALCRLLAGERGATLAEYAVFLCLLFVAAILGFLAVAGMSQLTYSSLASSVDSNLSVAFVAERESLRPELATRLQTASERGAQWTQQVASHVEYLSLLLAGGFGAVLAIALSLGFAKRRQKSHHQSDNLAGAARPRQVNESHQTALFTKRNLLRRILQKSLDNKEQVNLPVRYFMSVPPITALPHEPVESLASRMQQAGVRHLPVVGPDGQLLGIISVRDLPGQAGRLAKDTMTPNPITVQPETPVAQAITLLIQHTISCLPVTLDGRLCGVLTTTDLLIGLQAMIHAWEVVTRAQQMDVWDEADDLEEKSENQEPETLPQAVSSTTQE